MIAGLFNANNRNALQYISTYIKKEYKWFKRNYQLELYGYFKLICACMIRPTWWYPMWYETFGVQFNGSNLMSCIECDDKYGIRYMMCELKITIYNRIEFEIAMMISGRVDMLIYLIKHDYIDMRNRELLGMWQVWRKTEHATDATRLIRYINGKYHLVSTDDIYHLHV